MGNVEGVSVIPSADVKGNGDPLPMLLTSACEHVSPNLGLRPHLVAHDLVVELHPWTAATLVVQPTVVAQVKGRHHARTGRRLDPHAVQANA